jgi:hypothetical protein
MLGGTSTSWFGVASSRTGFDRIVERRVSDASMLSPVAV